MIISYAIIHSFFLFTNQLIYKKLFNPFNIFIFITVTPVSLLYIFGFAEISDATLLFLLAGMVCLNLGAYSNFCFSRKFIIFPKFKKIKINFNLILVFCLLFVLYELKDLSLQNFVQTALERRMGSEVEWSGIFSVLTSNLFLAICLLSSFKYCKDRRLIYLVPFFLSAILAFVELSRAVLLINIIFLALGIWFHGYGRGEMKVAKIVLLGLVFFIGVGVLRGSLTFDSSSEDYLLKKSLLYLCGGYLGFDQYFNSISMISNLEDNFLFNTAPAFAKFLDIVGFDIEVNYFKYRAVRVPEVTNIFTLYRQLLADFGLYGSMLFMFLNGWLLNYLFRYFQRKNYSESFTMEFIFLTLLLFWCFSPFYSIFLFIFPILACFLASLVRF